jgi:hypothetical protein
MPVVAAAPLSAVTPVAVVVAPLYVACVAALVSGTTLALGGALKKNVNNRLSGGISSMTSGTFIDCKTMLSCSEVYMCLVCCLEAEVAGAMWTINGTLLELEDELIIAVLPGAC